MPAGDSSELEYLIGEARRALERAHAPYSRFPVGAVLVADDGSLWYGCNVENASLSLGLCAERNAVMAALSAGRRPGSLLVVVTESDEPTPPCGACREVLRELAPNTEIVSVSRTGQTKRWSCADLLPRIPHPPEPDELDPRSTIAKKRDGQRLSASEIRAFISGLLSGQVQQHQMSAFMMAVYMRGMDLDEVRHLTEAMLESGRRLRRPEGAGWIDKHSTGGVGDKVSLPLVPLAVSAGLRVPMISGRGLGHTGGTLDKLESIPGYRTDLSLEQMQHLMEEVGCFIAGQTAEIVPADRLMYALRDVSATIESVPLIVGSILSKKLAAGLSGLVLDVKFGRGAFMKDRQSALVLARSLVGVARSLGLPALALLTRMDEPLGRTVGNALEMAEGLRLLHGDETADDLLEVTLALGGLMLALEGRCATVREGADLLRERLRSGAPLEAARRWIGAQGGDARVVDDPLALEVSSNVIHVDAHAEGFLGRLDALAAGNLCVALGGGRRRSGEPIDRSVGLVFHKKTGDRVGRGERIVTAHLPNGMDPDDVLPALEGLVSVQPDPVETQPLVDSIVGPAGTSDEVWDARVPDLL